MGRIYTFRFTEEEVGRWRAMAGTKSLTAWIRDMCNGGPQEKSNKTQILNAPILQEAAAIAKRTKQCVHGTAKGYHCWMCRGLAVMGGNE